MVKEGPIWLGLTREVVAAGLELLAGGKEEEGNGGFQWTKHRISLGETLIWGQNTMGRKSSARTPATSRQRLSRERT